MALQSRDAQERKRHGRHYTPPELARFLARRALLYAPCGAELRVLDPACGDGELLLAVHREMVSCAPGVAVRLTGYDLDRAAVGETVARAAAEEVEIHCRVGDFLAKAPRLAKGSFDLIISNPPYVRTQQLGGATAQLLSRKFGLRGRIDLTHPFVALAPRLLAPGGVLGLLCANRFLTTRAGANLRRILTADLTPVELYDLGDTKLFSAAVLPAITIATRSAASVAHARALPGDDTIPAGDGASGVGADNAHQNRGTRAYAAASASASGTAAGGAAAAAIVPTDSLSAYGFSKRSDPANVAESSVGCRYVSVYERTGDETGCGTELFDALAGETDCLVGAGGRVFAVEVGTLASQGREAANGPAVGRVISDHERPHGETVWRMSRPAVDRWLDKIADRTWHTFGETARIRVGIKTTADRVFISDHWDDLDPTPERELLQPLITHHDLERWQIKKDRGTRVLYPYDLRQTRRTPVDLAEFPCAAEYLRTHEKALSGRRYVLDGGRKWYEIWVPQRPHLWGAPKLVFPDISERPRFALDRSGAVVNGDCYWISLTDLDAGKSATDLAYLLMGVANSALGLRFYDAVCGNRLYSGRRRWITQYVARLPLPDPCGPAAVEIVRRVRGLLEDGVAVPDAAVDEAVAEAFGVSAQ
ncbi:Eco57I restriction-modification methylase domain-containing protein [Nocardia ignorata]|uniref:site-specific DNA-methyltransferase (adenine-specific) n=1 Tax=Nocardia ignorata TaxID=145285 RepID=A0A4R6PM14_NOCIG|nr:N-6 DNA methylase [Nocardia ignorata]TDP38840.1 TaqI restriction endonuclease [Nocardia ignorata]